MDFSTVNQTYWICKYIIFLILIEHFFTCPYCFESISVLIDTSIPQQNYIEDCEVCCNPMEIKVRSEHGEVIEFDVQDIGQ